MMMAYPSPGHTDPKQTPEQIANCRKLAAYLRTLPADYPDFEMSSYVNTNDVRDGHIAHIPVCGTAACAAGHGPRAGIAPLTRESWRAYSKRCFVTDTHEMGSSWDWCFSGAWCGTDNTVHGAAARIEYMLEHGVPSDSDAQRDGRAPLSYTAAAQ